MDVIEDTWAYDILKDVYPNIRLWYCASMPDEVLEGTPHKQLGILDGESHVCAVPFKDDLLFQFKKMKSAIQSVPFDTRWADWIFITNTSTYVNVPLLNDFVQSLAVNDYTIYSSRVFSSKYMSGPWQWCFYPEGSGILFQKEAWLPVLTNPEVYKNFIKYDTFAEPDKWRRYKRMIFDTAFGGLIDEYLTNAADYDCLKIYGVDDYYLNRNAHDHTKFYQDWNGINALQIEESDWWRHITMNVYLKDYDKSTELMQKVHDIVAQEYEEHDYRTDMRTISEYINSDKTPLVTQTEDRPECCIETVERIPYDEYHKWLCENSDIPNLEVDENGDLVESDGTPKKNGVRYVGPADCHHMTYAQYFNIRFWNHCCWYKNPFSVLCGYGRHGHADG